MMRDIATIVWKELREILLQSASASSGFRRGWVSVLIVIGVFGIFLPLQVGTDWVTSPAVMVYWAWVPLLIVTGITADSFAGERERHTLETLLASRLSDRAIWFGKVAAAIAYGWGITLASLVLGLITVNVANAGGGLLLYPARTLLAGLLLSFLVSGLAATAGVLVSLRASTVRQAAQTMSIAMMVVIFGPILGARALPPETVQRLAAWFSGANLTVVLAGAIGVLLLLDGVLLLIAMARFQRARLILD